MFRVSLPTGCCQSAGVAFVVVDLAQHGGQLEKTLRFRHYVELAAHAIFCGPVHEPSATCLGVS